MIQDSPLLLYVYWQRDGADSLDSCSARFSSFPNFPLREFKRSFLIDFSSKVWFILGSSLSVRSNSLYFGLALATVVKPKRISSCRLIFSSWGRGSLLKLQLGLNFISSSLFCMSFANFDFFCAQSWAISSCNASSLFFLKLSWYFRIYRSSMVLSYFFSLPRQNIQDYLYFFSLSVEMASTKTGFLGFSLSGTYSGGSYSSGYSGYYPKPPISGTFGCSSGGFQAGGCWPSTSWRGCSPPSTGAGAAYCPYAGFSGSYYLGSYLGGTGYSTLGGLTSSLFQTKVAMLIVFLLYSLSLFAGFSSSLCRDLQFLLQGQTIRSIMQKGILSSFQTSSIFFSSGNLEISLQSLVISYRISP